MNDKRTLGKPMEADPSKYKAWGMGRGSMGLWDIEVRLGGGEAVPLGSSTTRANSLGRQAVWTMKS